MEAVLSMCVSSLGKGGEHVFDCAYNSYVFLLFYLDIKWGQSGCMDADGTKWQIVCDHPSSVGHRPYPF